MLRFIDGTQVRVTGLNEVMAHLCFEGRQANRETAEEIIRRLEEQKNFIPSSDATRREYARVLLAEYAEYLKGRENQNK
jgi:hypothetical protein